MRVSHRDADVGVAKTLLNGKDVIAVLQQVRGKGVPERVTSDARGAPRRLGRLPDRALLGHRQTVGGAAFSQSGQSTHISTAPWAPRCPAALETGGAVRLTALPSAQSRGRAP